MFRRVFSLVQRSAKQTNTLSSAPEQVIMADAIVGGMLKPAAGWLLAKGRERAAKRLRDGDVVDQELASFITRDLDDIRTNLNAMKRTNLLASIDFYNEGVKSIAFDAVDSPAPSIKRRKIDHSSPAREVDVAYFFQANVKLSPDSKKRFKDARKQAVLALSNTALKTKDSILAMYIKVMAQLLEGAGDPTRALLFCKGYLEEMHGMKTIIANFKSEFKKGGIKRLRSCCKRRNIIRSVCHVNRVVFDIAQSVGGDKVFRELFIWPTIKIKSERRGKEEIDVLRDPRIDEVLREQGLEPSSVIWSFGDQSEEEEHKLKRPQCIATNSQGDFVVLDGMDIKVYDSSGSFRYYSCLPRDCKFRFHTVDADNDIEGNLYLLAWKTSKDHGQNMEQLFEVFVFDNHVKFRNKFSLRNKSKGLKLALNSHGNHTEVLVLESRETGLHDVVGVYRYETEGAFDREFGTGILRDAKDIVSATNGRILVLDEKRESRKKCCVRVFDAEKQQLYSFDVFPGSVAIAFHRASEHLVIISVSKNREEPLLSINNINSDCAEPERTYKLDEAEILSDPNITVTPKGRIAVVLTQNFGGLPKGKVIML